MTDTPEEKRAAQNKAAGLTRVASHWVIETERTEALKAVNRALKPFKDRARKQLKKWKDNRRSDMYYEEKLIDGVLMCRYMPDAKWQQCSIEKMSKRIVEMKAEIQALRDQMAKQEK